MNDPIMWTPSDLYSGFLAVCGLIITVWAVLEIIGKVAELRRRPNKTQDERIKNLETKVSEHDGFLENDKHKLENIQAANRVTLEALSALLKHAIYGNDIDDLKAAQKDLEDYLREK